MTTVLGRKVTGEIVENNVYRVEQWPGEKFLEYLDALLNLENVESVKWTQYTPYFNDGESCVFNVQRTGVKIVNGDPENGGYGDGYLDKYDLMDYSNGYNSSKIMPGFEEVHPVFMELSKNMGHFENFLQESFGDHASVTATKEGFDVEFYDHD